MFFIYPALWLCPVVLEQDFSFQFQVFQNAKRQVSFCSFYDVGHNVAQEHISFYYEQVLIGGLFKAYWALGDSLGPDTFVRKSPREHQYL